MWKSGRGYFLMKIIKRQKKRKILVQEGKRIIEYSDQEFLKKHKIYGIIRIQKEDFKHLKWKKRLTHYNIQVSKHKPKKKYLLIKILKHGFYTKGKEQPPILDLKNARIAECLESKDYLHYEQLKKKDFKYSFKNIKTIPKLKKAIIKRYHKSLPNKTKKELLKLGISKTELKIIKKLL